MEERRTQRLKLHPKGGQEESRMNLWDRLALLLQGLVVEEPSLHVYRELQIWDGERWVSRFALPAGTRHRILHYAGARRPDDALLPALENEREAA
jgi:hypothetical protein